MPASILDTNRQLHLVRALESKIGSDRYITIHDVPKSSMPFHDVVVSEHTPPFAWLQTLFRHTRAHGDEHSHLLAHIQEYRTSSEGYLTADVRFQLPETGVVLLNGLIDICTEIGPSFGLVVHPLEDAPFTAVESTAYMTAMRAVREQHPSFSPCVALKSDRVMPWIFRHDIVESFGAHPSHWSAHRHA